MPDSLRNQRSEVGGTVAVAAPRGGVDVSVARGTGVPWTAASSVVWVVADSGVAWGVAATVGSGVPRVWTSVTGGSTVGCGVGCVAGATVREATAGPAPASLTTSCTVPRSSAAMGCQLTELNGPRLTAAVYG